MLLHPAAVVVEVQRLSSLPLWPGFEPGAYPLALCDGERTWLFGHPAPPPDYLPSAAVPGARVLPQVAFQAPSTAEIGGVLSATVILAAEAGVKTLTDAAALAIHELFHVHQARAYPHWQANEAHRFTYPVADAELLTLRRLETEALRRALEAADDRESARWGASAAALRMERHARLPVEAQAYEDGLEAMEGLAFYVEHLARQDRAHHLPAAEFAPDGVRQRCYAVGRAYALLLDRHAPGWQAEPIAHPAALVALGGAAAFTEQEVAAAAERARADVAVLLHRRRELRSGFLQQPGEVLEVVADAALLWPKGFDPMNLHRLDGAEVLHTRFLRLGNLSGQIEVVGRPVLTLGAGAHPVFNGLCRAMVTGLPRLEPEATGEGGIRIEAEGLKLAFAQATAERCGTTLVIRVGDSPAAQS